jgi:GntR family transcriptional regulator
MPDPMYRQIADDLRQKIESGELGHGDQLPTELDLREEYEASRNTVRDAVRWLITRGLVETRPGQGTFVIGELEPYVTVLDFDTGFGEGAVYGAPAAATRKVPYASDPRIEIHQAVGNLAKELQLEGGAAVISRNQQRFIDDKPWSLQTTWYPMSFVDRGAVELIQAKDMPGGVVRYLEDVLGIKQVGWRDKISVRPPDKNEALFFGLPDDGRVEVFEIRRIAFQDSGAPLRLTVTTFPADRNEFVVHVGRVPNEMPARGERANESGP